MPAGKSDSELLWLWGLPLSLSETFKRFQIRAYYIRMCIHIQWKNHEINKALKNETDLGHDV